MNPAARLRAGRQAALLFIGGGLITMVNAPMGAHAHVADLAAAGAAAFGIGLCALVAPWGRWPARASLVTLVPPALALIVIANWFGHASSYSYALYYILIFVWVGLTQPRLTSLALAPIAAVAYVSPVLGGQSRPALVVSLTDALPVCLLVGETIAWVMERLSRAQQQSASRVSHLEALVGAGAALECMTDPAHLPDEVARVAGAVFDSETAGVVIGRDQTMTLVGRHGEMGATIDWRTIAGICARGEPAYLSSDRTLVVPLRAALRTTGALVVRLDTEPDEFVLGLARVFGSQAGLALERHRAVDRWHGRELVDPATGLATRAHADLLIGGLQPGDVVLALAITGPRQAEAAFLLGPFLERELRAYDSAADYEAGLVVVILRHADNAAEAAARRIGGAWARAHPSVPLMLGMTVHHPPAYPEDTVDAARAAMAPVPRPPSVAPWEGTSWAV